MFWIVETTNQKMGLITWLSGPVMKLTAFKNDGTTKFGNLALLLAREKSVE